MRSRCQLADACSVLSDHAAEIGAGQHQVREAGVADRDLLISNCQAAIVYGVLMSQAAIHQVLTGGDGPLGRPFVEGEKR